MDSLFKFSDYDVFAYLASGLIVLGVCDVAFGTHLVLDVNWSITHGAFVIIAGYVLGHIVAAAATLTLDRIFVRGILGRPSDILMRKNTSGCRRWLQKWLLAGFLEPLAPGVQQRALERAGLHSSSRDRDVGEQVFARAWAIIKRDPIPYARMDSFLRLYGFCRNLSFVAVLSAIVFYFRPPAVLGLPQHSKLPFYGTLVIALVMFHRYLKFWRAYCAEAFYSYAEPAEH